MVDDEAKLIIRTPDAFSRRDDIDARIRHEALEIDPSGRRLLVRNMEKGKEWWEPYDQLLVSTGAVPICPEAPGADAEGIFGVSTLASGLAVRAFVDEHHPVRAVIVGGGYIGLEMAEALLTRGLSVSLVQKGEQVMNTLDPDMGALVSAALREVGVTLYLGETATGFETRGKRVSGVVTDQRTIPADLVILGIGVRPETTLAKRAGIPLGVKGAITVNDRMQTGVKGIWAAGDCAESFHLVSRSPVHIALGTIANRQGRVAGINLGGGYATFPGVVGTAITKICSVEVARTGLREKDITRLGQEFTVASIESRTRARYYPGAEAITVKLLAENGSGRLLGGQIVGGPGSAKRIDVIATALHAGFRVSDLVNLDLGYAPPFSPVWDPVQIAARVLEKKL